jgi:hypothetical protein
MSKPLVQLACKPSPNSDVNNVTLLALSTPDEKRQFRRTVDQGVPGRSEKLRPSAKSYFPLRWSVVSRSVVPRAAIRRSAVGGRLPFAHLIC